MDLALSDPPKRQVDFLLIVTPIERFCNCSMFCCALLYVRSSFASISMVARYCCVAFPHGATGLSAVCDIGIS